MGGEGRSLQRLESVEPSHLVGRALVASGLITAMIGILLMLIVVPLGSDDAASFVMRLPVFLQTVISWIPEGTPLLVLLLPGAVTFVSGVALLRRGRRHLVATYHAGALRTSENTLLYLRPFVADKSPLPFAMPLDFFVLGGMFDMRAWAGMWLGLRGVRRYEEFIAYALRSFGTLVTIGDPTERLPQLGATRVYVRSSGSIGSPGEDVWKTEVNEQITHAKFILLHVGSSDSVRWEMERVVAVADPQRVALCVNLPGKRKPSFRNLELARRAEVSTIWREFRESYGTIFPRGLPEAIGDARFVKFDANWTAEPVQLKRGLLRLIARRPQRDTIAGALGWLTWVMVPERFARRLAKRFINVASFFILVVLVILAGIALFVGRS